MTEFEGFAELFGEDSEGGSLFENAKNNPDFSDVQRKFEGIKEKYPKNINNLNKITISRDADGIKIKIGDNEIKAEDLQKQFNGDVKNLDEPDLKTFYKNMGVATDENELQIEKLDNAANQKFNDKPIVKQVRQLLNNPYKDLPEPKNSEEFKAKVESTWKDTIYEGAKYVGGVAVSWLPYLAAYILLDKLYDDIKNHQNAMNGCWLVNTTSGNKCKIGLLSDASTTANPTDPNSPFAICDVCTDYLGESTANTSGFGPNFGTSSPSTSCPALSFNPGLSSNLKTIFSGNPPAGISPYSAQSGYPGTGYDGKGNCPFKFNAIQTTCVTQFSGGDGNACDGGGCDNSNNQYNLPANCVLKCVNVGFWGAFNDMFPIPVPSPSTLLDTILKWCLYALGIIVVIFIIYLLGKRILNQAFSGETESSGAGKSGE
jgi:hypothetical protein